MPISLYRCLLGKIGIISLFAIIILSLSYAASGYDSDKDGVDDEKDNCIGTYNPDQYDIDYDGLGDACDPCDDRDNDGDYVVNCKDNCPDEYGPESNSGCPEAPPAEPDNDKDGIPDKQDNCMYAYNPYQEDLDYDGVGDACDSCDDRDFDSDGIVNCADQCPDKYGPASNDGCPAEEQAAPDADKDGIPDSQDNCPSVYNIGQEDSDDDGTGDACETYDCSQHDSDSDKINDCIDKCVKEPETANGYLDDDGCPDTVPAAGTVTVTPKNADSDSDGIPDKQDNCPTIFNPSQSDFNMDGIGDACEKGALSDGQILLRVNPSITVTLIPRINTSEPRNSMLIAQARPSGPGGIGALTVFVDGIPRRTCFSTTVCTAVIPDLNIRNLLGAMAIDASGQIGTAGTIANPSLFDAYRTNSSCAATAGQNDSDSDGVRDSCDRCDLSRACVSIGREGSTDISCNGRSSRAYSGGQSYLSILYDSVSPTTGCGCKDTDGINYFEHGTTYVESVSGGISAGDAFGRGAGCQARSGCTSVDEDYCIDDRILSESYCGSSGPSRREVTCPGGCQDGRCACQDTDNGLTFYQRGSLLGRNDTCAADNRTLTEYTCGIGSSGAMEAIPTNYTCPYGCQDGACLCTDSDSGINTDVAGRIGLGFNATDLCLNYGTGPSQIIREYFSQMRGDRCIANFTDSDCPGACVNGSCRAPSCYDRIRNQGESDIDCGGPCAACQYMMVTGRITYEDGYSWGNESASTTYFNRTMMSPVRSVTVRFMPGAGTTETSSGPVRTTTTDSQGRFTFIIPRWPGARFFLRTNPENYAAKVNYDYSGCNKYVRFYTGEFTLPSAGNLDLGELPIYQYTDGNWHVYWTEDATVGCGSGFGTLSGQAAYFNLAEGAIIARDFIESNRDDDDSLDQVDILYPKTASSSGAAVSSSSSGEISIPPPNSFYGLENPGYREKTLFHEYGHFTQSEISMSDTNFGSPDHEFCTQKDEEFAMSEGWAEFLAQYLLNKNRNLNRTYISMSGENGWGLETPYCPGGLNEYIEGGVMAVLWDMADAPGPEYPAARNESFDTISGHAGTIVTILDTEMDNLVDAPDMCELVNGGGDGWRDRTGLGSAIDNILRQYGMGGVADDSGC